MTVLSPNLSGGSALACVSLAQALSLRYDVQLLGTTFGEHLGPGLQDSDYPLTRFRGRPLPAYLATMWRIAGAIRGDLVLAHQLRLPSFGTALLRRARRGTPIALYIDDDDIALTMPGRKNRLRSRLRAANGDIPTRLMHQLRHRADLTFCGSEYFSNRFGGITIPLGRDPALYQPDTAGRRRIREQLGFGDRDTVIAFMGNPRPHVGIEDLVAAIDILGSENYVLFVAPAGCLSDFAKEVFERTSIRITVRENQPSSAVPGFLDASDVVVVPQRSETYTQGQLPARLVEAMAMAKPVITTRFADIPALLGDSALYVPERSPVAIAHALESIRASTAEARRLAEGGRAAFLEHLTFAAMCRRLSPAIDAQLAARSSTEL